MTRILAAFVLIVLPALADERILSFESSIVVEKGGDLVVTETIRVRAEGVNIKRGIYRDIPRLHQTKWGLKKKKPFKVESVKKDGKNANYETGKIGKGGIRIKIGRENHFLKPGEHTYEIKYRTGMQLYFEEDRDVLYWNVNGTEWGFPTDKVTATVTLPEGIEVTRVDGSTGRHGAKGTDFKAEKKGNTASFSSTRILSPFFFSHSPNAVSSFSSSSADVTWPSAAKYFSTSDRSASSATMAAIMKEVSSTLRNPSCSMK